MAGDLWGPVQPPRWMSNYETSALNQRLGREAASSFNEAWNASFGREQQGKLAERSDERQASREEARDTRIAKQQLERDRITDERKWQHEDTERKRIAGEWSINQSIINQSEADRKIAEFKEKLAPFMQSLSPLNQPPAYSVYGSPGGPEGSLAPWLTKSIDRLTKPGEESISGLKKQGPGSTLFEPNSVGGLPFDEHQTSPVTGESGPFDPTYEDYQRAKSEHPALWLDPVTAPTMQKMDQSWDEMEKVRMQAEMNKDRHLAFEQTMQAKNLALDVGTQGTARFGFREDAYQKAPSEIQHEIDQLPNRGRYSEDDPISKTLKFSPYTAAAENILNRYLADQGKLRIDGANAEDIRQKKIEAARAINKGGSEEISFDSKGKETHKFKAASEIKAQSDIGKVRADEQRELAAGTIKPGETDYAEAKRKATTVGGRISDIEQLMQDRDRREASGQMTPEDRATYSSRIKKASTLTGARRDGFLALIDAEKEARDQGDDEMANRISGRIDKLSGAETGEDFRRIRDNIDLNEVKLLDKKLAKTAYDEEAAKLSPSVRKIRDGWLAQKEELLGKIEDRHKRQTKGAKPAAATEAPDNSGAAPSGKITEDFWSRPPARSQAAPAAEPATTPAAQNNPAPTTATSTNAPAGPAAGTNAPATSTNAPSKLPQVKSQADINKAIDLANEAIRKGADPAAVRKRLVEMGVKLKE